MQKLFLFILLFSLVTITESNLARGQVFHEDGNYSRAIQVKIDEGLKSGNLDSLMERPARLRSVFIPMRTKNSNNPKYKLVLYLPTENPSQGSFVKQAFVPTLGQLRTLVKKNASFKKDLELAMNVGNLEVLFKTMPSERDEEFVTSEDLGVYQAIQLVQKLYRINQDPMRPIPSCGSVTVASEQGFQRRSEDVDYFFEELMKRVDLSMGVEKGKAGLSESLKAQLKSSFYRFFTAPGTVEQRLTRFLSFMDEFNTETKKFDPTKRNTSYHIRNAIESIIIENKLLDKMEESRVASHGSKKFSKEEVEVVLSAIRTRSLSTHEKHAYSLNGKLDAILRLAKRDLKKLNLKEEPHLETAFSYLQSAVINWKAKNELFNKIRKEVGDDLSLSSPHYYYVQDCLEKAFSHGSSLEEKARDFHRQIALGQKLLTQRVHDIASSVTRQWASELQKNPLNRKGMAEDAQSTQKMEKEDFLFTHYSPTVRPNPEFATRPHFPIPSVWDSSLRGPTVLTVLTQSQLDTLFHELASRPDLPFEYPADGCYARAHIMADYLAGRGVNSMKIFTESNSGQTSGLLSVKTINNPDGQVRWRYHVAPVVLVEVPTPTGIRTEYRVIDPSINSKRPMTPQEWYDVQTDGSSGYQGRKHGEWRPGGAPPAGNSSYFYFTDRYRMTPSYPGTWPGSYQTYLPDMMAARQVQFEKLSYQNYGRVMRSYMAEKGFWQGLAE